MKDLATRTRPIIRIFVSSTFSDFKVERDLLQQQVFPQLEQLCSRAGFHFQAIDLRWGVSAEAGLDHRTMQICFEELRRAQQISPEPNFLMLLGDRYGWRPLPEAISAAQFEKLTSAAGAVAKSADDRKSLASALGSWFVRDDNHLPPAYILRSRIGTRCENDGQLWAEAQEMLWRLINHAFPQEQLDARRFRQAPMPLDDRFGQPAIPEMVRFQASATEQEIWGGALTTASPETHVFACFRTIANLEDFRSESNPDGIEVAGAEDFLSVNDGRVDPQLKRLQAELRDEVGSRLTSDSAGESHCFALKGAKLRQFAPATDGSPQWKVGLSEEYQASLQQMCGWLAGQLTVVINRQIAAWSEPGPSRRQSSSRMSASRALEIELDEHLRFGEERTSRFVGRGEPGGPLERIQAYLDNDSRLPLLVHGDSGCGKTALMARAYQCCAASHQPIIRFLGTTPHSSDVRPLLSSLCLQLRSRNPRSAPLPTDVLELQQEFRQHLHQAEAARRPLILFLDALDQLSEADGGLHLHWLPGRGTDTLPRNVKIVVSCVSDRAPEDPVARPFLTVMSAVPQDQRIALNELAVGEANRLLGLWLRDAGRTFAGGDQNQAVQRERIQRRIASEKQCRQPLFLKLLFEEVRRWRSSDPNVRLYEPTDASRTASARSAAAPSANSHVGALLTQLVDRLSEGPNHGRLLVERTLGYFAAARRGLSETEALEILFRDVDYKASLDDECQKNRHILPSEPPRVPMAIWSRLRSDLAAYLAERSAPGGNVLAFFHRAVAEWLANRFVAGADWKPNERLAEFFGTQSRVGSLDDDDVVTRGASDVPKRPSLRQVDERPWQLLQAGDCRGLADLLGSSAFFVQLWSLSEIDARKYWASVLNRSGILPQAVYRRILAAPRSDPPFAEAVALLFHALSLETFSIGVWKELVKQARLNDPVALLRWLPHYAASMGRNARVRAAFRLHKELHDLALQMRSPLALATALAGIASYDAFHGDFSTAEKRYEMARGLTTRWGHSRAAQQLLQVQPHITMQKGDNRRALEELVAMQQECENHGNTDDAMRARMNQAYALSNLGRHQEARQLLAPLVDWQRSTGSLFDLQNCLGNLANTYTLDGQGEQALDVHLEEERVCRQIGGAGLAVCLRNQARIYWALEKDVLAKKCYREAYIVDFERQARASGLPGWLAATMKPVLSFRLWWIGERWTEDL